MLNYTVEELLEQLNKTLKELADKKSSHSNQQTKALHDVLMAVKSSVEKNKSVKVDNISREIKNSIDIKRPKWLNELKKDDTALLKELKAVIDAVNKKEVVREVDIKQSSWLKAALKKNAPPVSKDYSKLLNQILVAVKKEIKIPAAPTKMAVEGSVRIKDPVEVKKPTWYSKDSYTSILSRISTLLSGILKVSVQNKTIDVNLVNKDVSIQDKVEVYIKDGQGRKIDLDKQFGRIASVGGSSGSGVQGNVTVVGKYCYVKKEAVGSYTYYIYEQKDGLGWQIKRKTPATETWEKADGLYTGTYADLDEVWDDKANITYNYS